MDLREAYVRLSNINASLSDILVCEKLAELDGFLFDLGKAAAAAEEKAKAERAANLADIGAGEPKASVVRARLVNPSTHCYKADTPTHWNSMTSEGDKFVVEVFGPGRSLNAGAWVIAHKLGNGQWVTYSV